jgi:hypothetical protein
MEKQTEEEKRKLFAWKNVGYPAFCDFMALDNDGFLLRRFDAMNARVLLDLQYQISELESALLALDEECRKDPETETHKNRMDSIWWDHHKDNPRKRRGDLVRELQPLLQRYSKLGPNIRWSRILTLLLDSHIASFASSRAQQSADRSQIDNVNRWLEHYPNAISNNKRNNETKYLQHSNDLMTMSREHKSPIMRLCESSSLLRFLFRSRGKAARKTDQYTEKSSSAMMKWFSDSIVIIIGLLMLFGPLWWLNWVNNDVKRLAIITSFVAIFALSLRIVSEGRPFEVLAATAAYAAVLMVFMQKSSGLTP